MLSIEVWKPRIKIPKTIKKEIAELNPINIRSGGGVMPVTVSNVCMLMTDGLCEWHDDKHMDSAHSVLYIVRNDSGSYVQCYGHKVVEEQSVGTMVYLNIWKKHRQWHAKGKELPPCVWLAVCVDLEDPPESRSFCENMIRKAINLPLLDKMSLSV